jgi:hypothetical protein
LTLEEGTVKLSRNFGGKLIFFAVYNPKKRAYLISSAAEVWKHTFQYHVITFSDVDQERERSIRF